MVDWNQIEKAKTHCECKSEQCSGPCPDCGVHFPYDHMTNCQQEADERILMTTPSHEES